MKRALSFLFGWPTCGGCGQSCTGSYFGIPLCFRCGEPPKMKQRTLGDDR